MQITVSLIVDIPASAEINEIETLVQTAGRQAMRQAVRGWKQEHATCPRCGSQQGRTEGTKRRVIQTSFGRVDLALRRRRCAGCGGAIDRQKAVWQLWQAAHAQAVVEPTAQQVRQEREWEVHHGRKLSKKKAERLLVGLDGGWIASREQQGGMEGKVGVVASRVEAIGKRGRQRMTRRRYVATFESSTQLGKLAYAAVRDLQAEEAKEHVVLADGADWSKTETDLHFPDSIKILDWGHLWRKLHAAMRALHPGKGQTQRAWRKQQYEVLKPLLWQGQVQEALKHLQALRPPAEQVSIKAFEELLTYLENQREWMGNYKQWQ